MPKPHKQHWTQTPEGRSRLADITRNRHLRKRQEELKRQVEEEVSADLCELGQMPEKPEGGSYNQDTGQSSTTQVTEPIFYNSRDCAYSLDGLIEEQQRLIKELKRVNKQIDHRLVDLGLN